MSRPNQQCSGWLLLILSIEKEKNQKLKKYWLFLSNEILKHFRKSFKLVQKWKDYLYSLDYWLRSYVTKPTVWNKKPPNGGRSFKTRIYCSFPWIEETCMDEEKIKLVSCAKCTESDILASRGQCFAAIRCAMAKWSANRNELHTSDMLFGHKINTNAKTTTFCIRWQMASLWHVY